MRKVLFLLVVVSFALGLELYPAQETLFDSNIQYINTLELFSGEVVFVQTLNDIVIHGLSIPENSYVFPYQEVEPVAVGDSVFIFYKDETDTLISKLRWLKIFPEIGAQDSFAIEFDASLPFVPYYLDSIGFVLGHDNILYVLDGSYTHEFEEDHVICDFRKDTDDDVYMSILHTNYTIYGSGYCCMIWNCEVWYKQLNISEFFCVDDSIIFTEFFQSYHQRIAYNDDNEYEYWIYPALNIERSTDSTGLIPIKFLHKFAHGMHGIAGEYDYWSYQYQRLYPFFHESHLVDSFDMGHPIVGNFRSDDYEILFRNALFFEDTFNHVDSIRTELFDSCIVSYIILRGDGHSSSLITPMYFYPLNNLVLDYDDNGIDEIAVFNDSLLAIYSFFDIEFLSVDEEAPKVDKLLINTYPNPFNSSISIDCDDNASLKIFDINGHSIAQLPKGADSWIPDENLESGIYFIKAEDKVSQQIARVIYLK